jgi:hypothetical protein
MTISDTDVEEWKWRLERLRGELVAARVDQALFQELYDGLVNAHVTSGFWAAHYQRTYVFSQVMNVRRIAVGKSTNVALTSVVSSLERMSEDLTLTWYENLLASRAVSPGAQPGLMAAFKRDWCDGGTSIAPGIVRAHRRELIERVKAVQDWANETVAHINMDTSPGRLTWGQIRETLEYLGVAINRYQGLLAGNHWTFDHSLPDWQEPFRQALFE